jgi:hypothetical protein
MTFCCSQAARTALAIQEVAFTLSVNLVFSAAFCSVFFCRRGNRTLFLFTSLGTFGFGGAVTPTAAAIVPAAAPMALAAVSRTPSDRSCLSFFFAIC